MMEFDPKNVEEVGKQIIEFSTKLIEHTGNPIIADIGVDRMVRLSGEEALKQLAIAQDIVRQHRSLMFWLVKPIMPWIIERLAPIADIHLKITREHGCILLYGIKPRTPLYAIQLQPNKAPPIPDLIRITWDIPYQKILATSLSPIKILNDSRLTLIISSTFPYSSINSKIYWII